MVPEKESKSPTPVESGRHSILIVTYNSRRTIDTCLESVLANTGGAFEVIVVDNGSLDGTREYLESLTDPRVRVLASEVNLGFSAANNRGADLAGGEYLILLNPDTEVFPEWNLRLVAHLREGVGACGPLSDYVAGLQKYQLYLGNDASRGPAALARLASTSYPGYAVETKLLIGFCLAISHRLYSELGGLDPALFLGNDDLDLSLRLRRAGYRLAVALDVFVHHEGQASFGTLPKARTLELVQESSDVLADKLEQFYGLRQVPHPVELWGIPWFRPTRPVFRTGRTSIVILTLNQLEYTKRCLDSLERHTPEDHEVILVDNGSNDGTVAYLRQWVQSRPNARLVENQTNQGFARGNNQGMVLATGDYLVLLNNDTVVTEGWLTGLILCAESDPSTGAVGPRSNYVSGPQLVAPVPYDVASFDDFERLEAFAKLVRQVNAGQYQHLHRVVGFCLLVKRAVVDRVGGLDPQFGIGNFEDDDFCLRTSIAGFRVAVAHDVFVHHYGSKTFSGEKTNYQNLMASNWQIFKAKWGLPDNLPMTGYPAEAIVSQATFDPARHYVPLTPPAFEDDLQVLACPDWSDGRALGRFLHRASDLGPGMHLVLLTGDHAGLTEEMAVESLVAAATEEGLDLFELPRVHLRFGTPTSCESDDLASRVGSVLLTGDEQFDQPLADWAATHSKRIIKGS